MGLKLQHKLGSGFTVSYWSVQRVQVNYSTRQASFTLLGYKDEETYRNKGAHAVTRDIQMVRDAEFDTFFPRDTNENILTQCYQCAPAKEPLFAEAAKA